MKRKSLLKLMFSIAFFSVACNPSYYFKLDRAKNNTNQLKLDGYYVTNVVDSTNGQMYAYKIILYEQGTFYIGSFQDYENTNVIFKKSSYSFAGIYLISGDDIQLERNLITDTFWRKTKSTKHGRILNDKKFIADIYGDRIDTFRFVQHDFKPDSILFEKYKYVPKIRQR